MSRKKRGKGFALAFIAPAMAGALWACAPIALAVGDDGEAVTREPEAGDDKMRVARRRLEVMTERIESIVISSSDPAVPKKMHDAPLFRYDDETRGYVDGTIWRLGETGRQ